MLPPRPLVRRVRPLFSVPIVAFAVAACGSDGGPTANLSDTAQEGRSIALDNGCAACHGASGTGGVGPAYVGAFGRTVTLEDGSTVTADRDYLARSIREPAAEIVEGYDLPMPTNNLDDTEVDAVVQYIVELSDGEGSE